MVNVEPIFPLFAINKVLKVIKKQKYPLSNRPLPQQSKVPPPETPESEDDQQIQHIDEIV